MTSTNFHGLHAVDPSHFALHDVDPSFCDGLSKEAAEERREAEIERLADLQSRLWAEGKRALLVVFQGIDAAGKDGTIRHVMTGVNPAGVQVTSFKQPSTHELAHDFLWRCQRAVPAHGEIGIFNRSHYEEVIIVRVHPELLEHQNVPSSPESDPHFWKHRFDSINHWEAHLHKNGTTIVKFLLYISRDEQRKRFLSRIDDPTKNWKASPNDFAERVHWDDYVTAYDEMVQHTSTQHAPWYVIPANHKWYARAAVASIIAETLEDMAPSYPEVSTEMMSDLATARVQLLSESD